MSNLSKDPDKLLVVLPWFHGFYQTRLDDLMDREIEREAERAEEEEEKVSDRFSWTLATTAISKGWVSAFSAETKIPMEFESLKSPKEYNFSTDICFVLIPVEEIERIALAVKEATLRQVIKERHSDRSGFVSFYPNSLDDPKWQQAVSQWDHNQLETLLIAYLTDQEFEEEDLNDTLHNKPSVYEAAQYGWFTLETIPA